MSTASLCLFAESLVAGSLCCACHAVCGRSCPAIVVVAGINGAGSFFGRPECADGFVSCVGASQMFMAAPVCNCIAGAVGI